MRERRTPEKIVRRNTLPPLTKADTAIPMSARDFANAQRWKVVRPILIVAGSLAVAFVLTWRLTDFGQGRAFLSDGEALYRSGHYTEAVTTLSAAIAKRPRDAQAYRMRANAYVSLTQYERAKADLDKAVDLRPNDAEALAARAEVMIVWQGCSQEAVQDLTRTLDLAPRADAYSRRGACLLNLGRPAEAIRDLTHAMELDPRSNHYLERGTAYSAVGDHARAIADLGVAIAKNPSLPDAYRLRAGEREKMGDIKGAEEDRKRAVTAAEAGSLH